MKPIILFILNALAAIACVFAILWLAKCPGNLEWWRPICIGAVLAILGKFL